MVHVDLPNIPDIWHQRKPALEGILRQWGPVLVLILVAFGSFSLGRLSITETAKPAVSIAVAAETEPARIAAGGLIVASKSGTAYHFPWCSGATQIKPENRIWFADEEAAQKAGYAPSKSCKGLTK